MPPLISIITVVFNAESYLENTIQSVINQTYPNIDYIIIDGGSSDGTVDIIKRHESRLSFWISEKDKGIYDAMNKGLAKAKGSWVNFLNGGDAFYDEHTLMKIFGENDLSQFKFVYGDSINVSPENEKYIKPVMLSMKTLRRSLGLCHQAVFVRCENAPKYDLDYRYKAEYNWVIDIVNTISPASIKYVPVPVVYYSLGGFSEKGMLKNLREFIRTTRLRFGVGQVVLNFPVYLRIFLRYIKYTLIKNA